MRVIRSLWWRFRRWRWARSYKRRMRDPEVRKELLDALSTMPLEETPLLKYLEEEKEDEA